MPERRALYSGLYTRYTSFLLFYLYPYRPIGNGDNDEVDIHTVTGFSICSDFELNNASKLGEQQPQLTLRDLARQLTDEQFSSALIAINVDRCR